MRATSAAMAISSLSFSRGVRFIGQQLQTRGSGRQSRNASNPATIAARAQAPSCATTRATSSPPDAERAAATGQARRAALQPTRPRPARRGPGWRPPARRRHGRPVQRRPAPAMRMASCHSRCPSRCTRIVSRSMSGCTVSPITARPKTRVSTPRNQHRAASSTSRRRSSGAAIEQDRLLRQPFQRGAGPDRKTVRTWAAAAGRAVEALGGLARDGQRGALGPRRWRWPAGRPGRRRRHC